VVFESEFVKANLNPIWQPFRIGFNGMIARLSPKAIHMHFLSPFCPISSSSPFLFVLSLLTWLIELCKGNADVELLIECYDWDRFKQSDFIGSCKVPSTSTSTLSTLLLPFSRIY
jgi:hypothetical protein